MQGPYSRQVLLLVMRLLEVPPTEVVIVPAARARRELVAPRFPIMFLGHGA